MSMFNLGGLQSLGSLSGAQLSDLGQLSSSSASSNAFQQAQDQVMSAAEREQAVEQSSHAFEKSVYQACAQA